MAKELLAGFAAAEVDKLFETKGEEKNAGRRGEANMQVSTLTTERRPSDTPNTRLSRLLTSLESTR